MDNETEMLLRELREISDKYGDIAGTQICDWALRGDVPAQEMLSPRIQWLKDEKAKGVDWLKVGKSQDV